MEQPKSNVLAALILGLCLALGLLGAGKFVARSAYALKASEHYVSVKGLSEREVKANLAAWEIDFREVDNNLSDASIRLEQDQQQVITFLKNNGFSQDEIEIRPAKVNDLFSNPYNPPNAQTKFRYILTSGVRVRSSKVDQIVKVSQMTSDLIKQGIPLSFDTGDYNTDLNPNPSYYFTQLDSIRPAMLAEATNSARIVATQFATDSHSKLGKIRRASQGVFQISGRDASSDSANMNNQANSVFKKVRLVTTIDYFLK